MKKQKILIVEDESLVALETRNLLEGQGYEVVGSVSSGEKAIKTAESEKPDIILMDIRLKGEMDGIEAAEIIRNRFDIPVIFATAYLDIKRIEHVKATMPFGYILKPIQEKDLLVTVEMALYKVQAEAERKKVEDRFEVFFRAINDAVFVHPFQEEGFAPFIEVNDIACERYGYTREEFLTLSALDITKESNGRQHRKPDFRRMLLEKRNLITETHHIKKNGEMFPVEINANIVEYDKQLSILAVVRDITERRKTQEIMIQSEKMMSVGGMAAGMAHEINNPLGGMLQGIQTIKRRLSPNLNANIKAAEAVGLDLNRLQAYLEERQIITFIGGIQESGRKASDIIQNMLQFSRKSESKIAQIDIAKLVDKVLDLAGKEYNLKKKYDFRNIQIVKEIQKDLPLVPCTETEIEQVLVNLLQNAAWAMHNQPDSEPPKITIRINIDQGMLRMEIEDNGPGMAEEIRKHIFEPFYTTKPEGEGTGLGLAVSYMIITHNHEGTMQVESSPGFGTRFIMRIPLVRED